MTEVPSPDDVGLRILLWVGTPALAVSLVASFLAILGWKSFVQGSVRHGRIASANVRSTMLYWTTTRQRTLVRLLAASTVFVFLVYVLAQLIAFVISLSTGPVSITKVDLNSRFVLQQALVFSRWDLVTRWSVVATVASIVLLNLSDLADVVALRALLVAIWTLVLGLGLAAAAYLAFCAACMAIGLAIGGNVPPWLLIMSVTAAASAYLLFLLAPVIRDASRAVYA